MFMYNIIIPVISRAFLISSVSWIPVTLMPVNGSFPYGDNCNVNCNGIFINQDYILKEAQHSIYKSTS